jgi:hypothetical protein
MEGRVPAATEDISHLVYSRDGRFLAATSFGKGGLRVYRISDRALVKEEAYGDNTLRADFDKDGRLVTVSFDGFVRLYDRELWDQIIKHAVLAKDMYSSSKPAGRGRGG